MLEWNAQSISWIHANHITIACSSSCSALTIEIEVVNL